MHLCFYRFQDQNGLSESPSCRSIDILLLYFDLTTVFKGRSTGQNFFALQLDLKRAYHIQWSIDCQNPSFTYLKWSFERKESTSTSNPNPFSRILTNQSFEPVDPYVFPVRLIRANQRCNSYKLVLKQDFLLVKEHASLTIQDPNEITTSRFSTGAP